MRDLGLPLVFQERRHPAGRFLGVLVHFDDNMYDFYRTNAHKGPTYLPTIWGMGCEIGEQLWDALGRFCLTNPTPTNARLTQIKQSQYKGFIDKEAMLSFGDFRPKQALDANRACVYARKVMDVLVPYLMWERATAYNPERPVCVTKIEEIPQKEYAHIEVWAPFTEEEVLAILSKDLVSIFSGVRLQ